jgi:hypothetical protein
VDLSAVDAGLRSLGIVEAAARPAVDSTAEEIPELPESA